MSTAWAKLGVSGTHKGYHPHVGGSHAPRGRWRRRPARDVADRSYQAVTCLAWPVSDQPCGQGLLGATGYARFAPTAPMGPSLVGCGDEPKAPSRRVRASVSGCPGGGLGSVRGPEADDRASVIRARARHVGTNLDRIDFSAYRPRGMQDGSHPHRGGSLHSMSSACPVSTIGAVRRFIHRFRRSLSSSTRIRVFSI